MPRDLIYNADEGHSVLQAGDHSVCDALQYLVENRFTFPNVLDTSQDAWTTMAAYETIGMSTVPMTYFIDPEGKVLEAWYGFEKGRAEKVIQKLEL